MFVSLLQYWLSLSGCTAESRCGGLLGFGDPDPPTCMHSAASAEGGLVRTCQLRTTPNDDRGLGVPATAAK